MRSAVVFSPLPQEVESTKACAPFLPPAVLHLQPEGSQRQQNSGGSAAVMQPISICNSYWMNRKGVTVSSTKGDVSVVGSDVIRMARLAWESQSGLLQMRELSFLFWPQGSKHKQRCCHCGCRRSSINVSVYHSHFGLVRKEPSQCTSNVEQDKLCAFVSVFVCVSQDVAMGDLLFVLCLD